MAAACLVSLTPTCSSTFTQSRPAGRGRCQSFSPVCRRGDGGHEGVSPQLHVRGSLSVVGASSSIRQRRRAFTSPGTGTGQLQQPGELSERSSRELHRLQREMWRLQAEMKIVQSTMTDLSVELEAMQASAAIGDVDAVGMATLSEMDAQMAELEHWAAEQRAACVAAGKQSERLQLEL